MVFSSATFLFVFLPLVLLVYTFVPKKWKNFVLLVASVGFYAFGEPVYVILLLFTAVFNWLICLSIECKRHTQESKFIFIFSMIINLGILGFFKYFDFLITTINTLFHLSIPCVNLPLPIGISFFTFQTMSYTIDVYRGKYHAQKNFASLATFICLFPQLIAGPIVLYGDVVNELDERNADCEAWAGGITRFILGLSKKVLLANALGEIVLAFQMGTERSVLFCWLYAIAFMLQIYFDFSGYSDMAIGLGKMFGFHFPENFNYPYMSTSITEFWRRWHMTLGSWFREYVYIPMGGNRTTKLKWLRNLVVVWFLTGLWHGAAWNFILWGLMFGLILVVEKLFFLKVLKKLPSFFKHSYVLFVVMMSFVIFNDAPQSQWMSVIQGMFSNELPLVNAESLFVLKNNVCLLLVSCIGATDYPSHWVSKLRNTKLMDVMEIVVLMGLLILVTANIVNGSFNPFLYFRF